MAKNKLITEKYNFQRSSLDIWEILALYFPI